MQAEYITHTGSDLTVVNAAKVSFNKQSLLLEDKDISLINYLARGCSSRDWEGLLQEFQIYHNEKDKIEELMHYIKNMPAHWTPFAHPMITLRETVPIFITRQRFKHVVGFSYNETSRRYVDDTPEFHIPTEWRARPEASIKQGSGGVHEYSDNYREVYQVHINEVLQTYKNMISDGIAPEQARMILPQSMLTTYWATGSLYAWSNAYVQRADHHAQMEIQELAKQWKEIIEPLFPVSWKALTT